MFGEVLQAWTKLWVAMDTSKRYLTLPVAVVVIDSDLIQNRPSPTVSQAFYRVRHRA